MNLALARQWELAARGGPVEVHCHCGKVFTGIPAGNAHAWLPWVTHCPDCGCTVSSSESERRRRMKEKKKEQEDTAWEP